MAKTNKKKKKLTAKNADKHVLYQLSVQDAPTEIDWLEKRYKKIRKRSAKTFREDFCGTAWLSCEWASRGKDRHATGLDLEPSVLAWGREHNLEPLGDDAERVQLLERNVLEGTKEKFDIICALNFSYWIFKERKVMLDYYKSVRRGLESDGIFVQDLYGGWNAQEPMKEKRKVKGFTYVWDQAEVNPIDSSLVNYIHFEFPGGSKMKKAFGYEWRLWTMQELRELLSEAGFSETQVYWEQDDKNGEGNGIFRRQTVAENCPGWLAYLVALR